MSVSCSVHRCHDNDGGHGDGGEAWVRGGNSGGCKKEEGRELWKRERVSKAAEGSGVLKNRAGTPSDIPLLNTRDPTMGRSEINDQIRFGRRSCGRRLVGNGNFLFIIASDSPAPP